MYQINFEILRGLISQVNENEKSIILFGLNLDQELKMYWSKCRKLIRDHPNILIFNESTYDPDIFKTIAQAITIIAEYIFLYHNEINAYNSILKAINFLEGIQKRYNHLGFYDLNASGEFVFMSLESCGMYINPYRLASSVILFVKYSDRCNVPPISKMYESLKIIEKEVFAMNDDTVGVQYEFNISKLHL
jgi:hypothetical protein